MPNDVHPVRPKWRALSWIAGSRRADPACTECQRSRYSENPEIRQSHTNLKIRRDCVGFGRICVVRLHLEDMRSPDGWASTFVNALLPRSNYRLASCGEVH